MYEHPLHKLLFLLITLQDVQVSGLFSHEGAAETYHSDADGVIKLVHEDADDGRRQQQQDERIFELQGDKSGSGVRVYSDNTKCSYPSVFVRTFWEVGTFLEDGVIWKRSELLEKNGTCW